MSGRWTHRQGLVEPPLRLSEVKYDDSGVHVPTARLTGDESLLASHLVDAARILASAPEPDLAPAGATGRLSADFEHLRWFDLPAVCVD